MEADISEKLEKTVPLEAPYLHAIFCPPTQRHQQQLQGHLKVCSPATTAVPVVDGEVVRRRAGFYLSVNLTARSCGKVLYGSNGGITAFCAEKGSGKVGRKWLFDIDGTLVPYGEDARPSTRTLDALAALRAQGHKVFFYAQGAPRATLAARCCALTWTALFPAPAPALRWAGFVCAKNCCPCAFCAVRRRRFCGCMCPASWKARTAFTIGPGSVKLPWNFPRVTRAGEITA